MTTVDLTTNARPAIAATRAGCQRHTWCTNGLDHDMGEGLCMEPVYSLAPDAFDNEGVDVTLIHPAGALHLPFIGLTKASEEVVTIGGLQLADVALTASMARRLAESLVLAADVLDGHRARA